MLFKISPALTDTKHNEMALLETAASDPVKGDEMSFIWLNQWQNIIFFPFFQEGTFLIFSLFFSSRFTCIW